MKVILEKDYQYIGQENGWHKFMSKPKKDYDPEIIQVPRARMVKESGESVFFDPIKPISSLVRV